MKKKRKYGSVKTIRKVSYASEKSWEQQLRDDEAELELYPEVRTEWARIRREVPLPDFKSPLDDPDWVSLKAFPLGQGTLFGDERGTDSAFSAIV